MSAELLLRQFERVTDAAGAIEGLRRLVYRAAVSGRLVERDMHDSSVSELVEQLRSAKGSAAPKRQAAVKLSRASVSNGFGPFATPSHWAWLPLLEVGTLSGGMTPSKSRRDFWDGDIAWLSPKDIKSDDLIESELKITSAAVAATGLQIYPPGCLFIVARSGILKRTLPIGINRVPATANQDMKVLRPFVAGLERYLQIMFKGMTDFILAELVKTGTTVQSLKYDSFELQPIPLPPLAEQHRIVAKVDELMALCDQMEVAQKAREDRRDRVRTASLQRLTSTEGDGACSAADVRFFLHQSPRLITTAKHVTAVRHTIVDLAMRGRLVPQDPTDEESSGLQAPAAGGAKLPFDLPSGWKWSTLDLASTRIHYGYTASADDSRRDIRLLRITDIQGDRVNWESVPGCVISESEALKYLLAEGDILIARTGGTMGKSFLVDNVPVRAVFASYLIRVQPSSEVSGHYLKLFLDSSLYWDQLSEASRGTGQPNVNGRTLGALRIPVAPRPEQNRIVAKVDELMAVCDDLERALASSQDSRGRLLYAAVFQALEGAAGPG